MNDISGIEYHDAATKEWGNNWRTPTKKEFDELKDLCSWTLTNINETWGYTVTGPNGNSIFIPLAECKGDTRKYFCNEVGRIGQALHIQIPRDHTVCTLMKKKCI